MRGHPGNMFTEPWPILPMFTEPWPILPTLMNMQATDTCRDICSFWHCKTTNNSTIGSVPKSNLVTNLSGFNGLRLEIAKLNISKIVILKKTWTLIHVVEDIYRFTVLRYPLKTGFMVLKICFGICVYCKTINYWQRFIWRINKFNSPNEKISGPHTLFSNNISKKIFAKLWYFQNRQI